MKRLSEQAFQILNDPDAIAGRDLWFRRMMNLFDGVSDDYNRRYAFTLDGFVPRPADQDLAYVHPEEWVVECLEIAASLPECRDNRFAPLCVEYPIYGVHFIDRMFGADVYFKDGQWNAHYLTTPVGQLRMPDLETDETWSLARRAAQAFVDADVKLPLFGMPTLSSALNIMLNLYGQVSSFQSASGKNLYGGHRLALPRLYSCTDHFQPHLRDQIRKKRASRRGKTCPAGEE